MSAEIAYIPADQMPRLAACAGAPPSSPFRLEVGGDAAIVAEGGDPPAIKLAHSKDADQMGDALLVLIDLGGHRTLIYVLGGDPVYVDGVGMFATVLTANSPGEGRHVIRCEGLAGAIQVGPARPIRRLAAEQRSCAYCGGSINASEALVACGCSVDAIVHGADEGLDCWKRAACTRCGWPLAHAERPENVSLSHGVEHGTS